MAVARESNPGERFRGSFFSGREFSNGILKKNTFFFIRRLLFDGICVIIIGVSKIDTPLLSSTLPAPPEEDERECIDNRYIQNRIWNRQMVVENKSDELFRQLRTRVGLMPDGAPFPSVRQIMEEYRVSQATVTAGMKKLRELGLIESFIGRGTFVHHPAAVLPPKVLLLANSWPSLGIVEMIELLRDETLRRGLRFELQHFSFKEDVCTKLNDFDADAIVIDSLANDFLTPEQIIRINRCCVPVVISRSIVRVEGICYVCGNNSEAGIAAVNYLYQAGHRRLGVLFSEPHQFSSNELVKSFTLCARTNFCHVELFDCNTRIGENSIENAYRYIRENFSSGLPDISALFVVSSDTASGALRALREIGVRVPDELSVLGFGRVPPESPELTCVSTPRTEMARAILDIVEDRVGHHMKLSGQVEVTPVVIENRSVKILSHQAKEVAI